MSQAVIEETSVDAAVTTEAERQPKPLPTNVTKNLLSGTSTLGLGVTIERACGFLSNILAARLGGASTFGAYSLAISTANNVSTYAAGGIGSTAIRFSGEYPRGTAEYPALARALSIVAIVSAALAFATLWLGAMPLAKLLHKDGLTGILRWAGLCAAGIIILECCRGFFVGQRRLKALLLLSGFVGIGMLSALPLASYFGPVTMLCCQSLLAIGAVLLCLSFRGPLQLGPPVPVSSPVSVGSLLKKIWSYSVMQIAGLVGMNIAGWWLTSLVAKSDPTMVQMSFFAVAHQLRNMVALVPSLLIEGSFAEMANQKAELEKTPDNVMAFCTYASVLVSMLVAGSGIILIPWALALVYGNAYAGAAGATSLALATAVIHMGSGSASSRLSILSIKTAGLINTVWAIFVAATATLFLMQGGDAARGAGVYLLAHLFSAVLFIGCLKRRGNTPPGMISTFAVATGCILCLALLSVWREQLSATSTVGITGIMLFLWLATILFLFRVGKRYHWLPSAQVLARITSRFIGRRQK